MIMFITSIFVWHWFSTSVFGISTGWRYLSSWVLNFRPQINIKPQLVSLQNWFAQDVTVVIVHTFEKLVSRSDSCHSNASKMSLSMDQVDADVDVYLSPEQEELASVMKDLERVSSTASFASDLVSSVAA
ncbi:hypothetical protein KIN20_011085 [Parelaphostrongylus tenuis]|uniref:Uncharacterized protein n=1 Tax=Parelaphostrongylus tenuis TaxID=148309 RepID=A0AAD5QKT2_PARTN|nr:hypothetical protein KIN20_011085 [Parelaphostrongylus tenuis]